MCHCQTRYVLNMIVNKVDSTRQRTGSQCISIRTGVICLCRSVRENWISLATAICTDRSHANCRRCRTVSSCSSPCDRSCTQNRPISTESRYKCCSIFPNNFNVDEAGCFFLNRYSVRHKNNLLRKVEFLQNVFAVFTVQCGSSLITYYTCRFHRNILSKNIILWL